MERQREAASRRGGGGGGRPPVGRGDARNFSGGGGMMPPPDYNRNIVGIDDIKRLQSRNTSRQTSTTPQTFGPSSMFSSARGSNTRKPLFGNKTGEDSGASSRTGTPPTQKEKKDKEDKETSKNAFRFVNSSLHTFRLPLTPLLVLLQAWILASMPTPLHLPSLLQRPNSSQSNANAQSHLLARKRMKALKDRPHDPLHRRHFPQSSSKGSARP